MTTISFTVKTVESKISAKNNVPWVRIEDMGKNVYSVWPDDKNKTLFETAQRIKSGDIVSLDYSMNGTFRNVSRVVILDMQSPNPIPSMVSNGSQFNDKKDRRISRLASINAAIEYHKLNAAIETTTCTEQAILDTAEKFENWVYRGMNE